MVNNTLLSIDEVASQLRTSPSTVRRLVHSGKLLGHKVGNQWRFDLATVRKALDQGQLSGGYRFDGLRHDSAIVPQAPEWAKPLLRKWTEALELNLQAFRPDHVVVNDRRGAKVWSLLQPDGFIWGKNLWESTAVEVMTYGDIRRIFGNKQVMIFDELMQHGREMHELRELLESAQATVSSVVCVRRRSHVDSGDVLEYQAIALEDLDDQSFAERATAVSRLVELFDLPLDPDHIVLKAAVSLEPEELLERLAEWGIPFVVWYPPGEGEGNLIAITLDRPEFFEAEESLPKGFALSWDGPCKLRLYINLATHECWCSFVAFPSITAARETWDQAASANASPGSPDYGIGGFNPVDTGIPKRDLHRVYLVLCLNIALKMLKGFIESGAAGDLGIKLDGAAKAVDTSRLRATFGPKLGNEITKKTQEVLALGTETRSLFAERPRHTIPGQIRRGLVAPADGRDTDACRMQLLKTVPLKFAPSGPGDVRQKPISFRELMEQLTSFSESNVSRNLDYEVDRGTVKPVIRVEVSEEGHLITLRRAYCRGEYGAWFDWGRNLQTHEGDAIQRVLCVAPMVVQQFLEKLGEEQLTATLFDKVFANLQHDWNRSYDPLYLAWRPYKYGPVPTVPIPSPGGDWTTLQHFLTEHDVLKVKRESHGSQVWQRFSVPEDSSIPWKQGYKTRTSGMTRAHILGLLRLYAAIQQKCTTLRPSSDNAETMSVFTNPLVVLGTARNELVAYRCGWFEVSDWRSRGQMLFPDVGLLAEQQQQPAKPILNRRLAEFAAPAALLRDKVEMYRNLPYLRTQIEALMADGDLEAGEVLLETVDQIPRFDADSNTPMVGLEWAASIMIAFCSLTRQVLTSCGLDTDTRRTRSTGKVPSKGAKDYLKDLLNACPELKVAERDLQQCVTAAENDGILTKHIAETLKRAFQLILSTFDSQKRIPDPRPQYERDRARQQIWDGMLTRLRELSIPSPHAIAVVDIRNVMNIPRVAEIFGVDYEEAVERLLAWVGEKARGIIQLYPEMVVGGFSSDNVIIAGRNADNVYAATLELTRQTFRHLAEFDRDLFAPFGLLRSGLAWCEDGRGPEFTRVKAGTTAYRLGDRAGQPLGTIAATSAFVDHLATENRAAFAVTKESSGQGSVYVRTWDQVHDVA